MKGLLFSQMEPPPELESEFHDWYNTEHIPVRMAVPGFAGATRFEASSGEPRYLACYYLDDVAALESEAYGQIKSAPGERTTRMLGSVRGFTRYVCELQTDTGPVTEPMGLLFVTTFTVPDDEAAARLDQWYDGEHVPMLMKADGWLRVRRFRRRGGFDGPPWTHFALHELRSKDVLDSPERAQARTTPQRDELAAFEWFANTGRWLYRPIYSARALHNSRNKED